MLGRGGDRGSDNDLLQVRRCFDGGAGDRRGRIGIGKNRRANDPLDNCDEYSSVGRIPSRGADSNSGRLRGEIGAKTHRGGDEVRELTDARMRCDRGEGGQKLR